MTFSPEAIKCGFTKKAILGVPVPNASGVYGLFARQCIYVDQTDDLRTRLLQRVGGDNNCINDARPTYS